MQASEVLSLYGRVCKTRGNCENCLIHLHMGDADTSCEEFLMKNPQKAYELLVEMDEEIVNYYRIFQMRFPNNESTVQALASLVCRRVVFEGYYGCECLNGVGDFEETHSKCVACWLKQYVGDAEVEEEEEVELEEVDADANMQGRYDDMLVDIEV